MPRTKATTKTSNKKFEEEGIDKQRLLSDLTDLHNEIVDQYRIRLKRAVQEGLAAEYNKFTTDERTMTVNEFMKHKSLSTTITRTLNITDKHDAIKQTKTAKKGKRQVKRSSSLVDEGYLTTESSNSVGRASTRQSRSRQKNSEKPKRVTRSLSKSNQINFLTPGNNKIQPNTYGYVTPKCKPNMPQVLLRRPKAGEVALSFQGSPLMTAPVMNDDKANVNIPLNDGTLLSLRAQDGLRLSQIPQFDNETLKQLNTLSRNIHMVLQAAENINS